MNLATISQVNSSHWSDASSALCSDALSVCGKLAHLKAASLPSVVSGAAIKM